MRLFKHKQMLCRECGCSIGFSYAVPEREYSITENGEIQRNDNNLSDKPAVIFHCTNDREHNIGDEKELFIWMNAVEFEFFERGLYAPLR